MENISAADRRTISRYLALDERRLYSLIPPHVSEHESTLFDPRGQEEEGRRFFARIRRRLQKAVCEEFDWPAKKDNSAFNDSVTLVATVADVVSGLTFNVPPFVVATLLVKQGLNALCAGHGAEPEDGEQRDDGDGRGDEA